MALCKLSFVFILVIKLSMNVVFLSAVRISPLTSIRVVPIVDIDANPGEFTFGERVPGDRPLPLDVRRKYIHILPNLKGGVREHTAIIDAPYEAKITRVELHSGLGSNSKGERVHEMGYGPNHKSVAIKFWSKPNHGIDFTVELFGF